MKTILIIIMAFFCFSSFGQKKDTVKTESGIKYIALKKGKGETLKDKQKVKVYYTGKFMNGKQFESNRGGKPFRFVLGAEEVIPGWDEGFKLMRVGEKGILIIPSNLAYGKSGVKHWEDETKYHIPPNADLIFEIEIVDAK